MAAGTRIGRPIKRAKVGELTILSIRVPADLKAKLVKAAERSGHSYGREAELRLIDSFRKEEFRGSPEMIDSAHKLQEAAKILTSAVNRLRSRLVVVGVGEGILQPSEPPGMDIGAPVAIHHVIPLKEKVPGPDPVLPPPKGKPAPQKTREKASSTKE